MNERGVCPSGYKSVKVLEMKQGGEKDNLKSEKRENNSVVAAKNSPRHGQKVNFFLRKRTKGGFSFACNLQCGTFGLTMAVWASHEEVVKGA